jgi:hypothetical protein
MIGGYLRNGGKGVEEEGLGAETVICLVAVSCTFK